MILARRELVGVGESRLRRIYRDLGLQARPRRKRKVRYVRGNTVSNVVRPNERWSIDFMRDRLGNGRTFRTMNVIDDFTRKCFALEVGFSFGNFDVVRCFEAIAFERGLPTTIRFDNAPGSQAARCCSGALIRPSICISSIRQADAECDGRVAKQSHPR